MLAITLRDATDDELLRMPLDQMRTILVEDRDAWYGKDGDKWAQIDAEMRFVEGILNRFPPDDMRGREFKVALNTDAEVELVRDLLDRLLERAKSDWARWLAKRNVRMRDQAGREVKALERMLAEIGFTPAGPRRWGNAS